MKGVRLESTSSAAGTVSRKPDLKTRAGSLSLLSGSPLSLQRSLFYSALSNLKTYSWPPRLTRKDPGHLILLDLECFWLGVT